MTEISVLITIYESEDYIYECLKSILSQTVKDFELIIVEDPPYDNSEKIIMSFNDARIKYFRNKYRLGLTESRNICIKYSSGNYLFFTDDDCIVSNNWLEEGLKILENVDCAGVEGKTYYVSENYQPTFSDYGKQLIENGGIYYATCNIVYKKSIFNLIGGFDPEFKRMEDYDFGYRVIKKDKKIIFNPNMIVYHQYKVPTLRDYLNYSKIETKAGLSLSKKHKLFDSKYSFFGIIAYPIELLFLLCPLWLLSYPVLHPELFKTKRDWGFLAFTYLKALFTRLIVWKFCFEERVLLI